MTPERADLERSRYRDAALPPDGVRPEADESARAAEPAVDAGGVSGSDAAADSDESDPSRQLDAPLEGLPELPLTTRVELSTPQPPAPVAAPPPTAANPAVAASPAPRAMPPPVVDDRESIQLLLQGYRDALTRLDSASAALIWPTVDTRALNRAFSTVSQQEIRFERCSLKLDDQHASALCIGEIYYVRRHGDQTPRTQSTSWRFEFVRRSDRWEIANVDAR